MRTLEAEEMIAFIAFLAVLLVFFSIDIRSRDTDRDLWHELLFEYTSRVGGVATAIALASGWVFAFTQKPTATVHLILLAIPGSIAVLAAIVLGIEILFVANVPDRTSPDPLPLAGRGTEDRVDRAPRDERGGERHDTDQPEPLSAPIEDEKQAEEPERQD